LTIEGWHLEQEFCKHILLSPGAPAQCLGEKELQHFRVWLHLHLR